MSQPLLPWNEKIAPSKLRKKRKSESQFWNQLKRAIKKYHPSWNPIRLESTASLGLPDVVVAANGNFAMWELKVCTANAVRISAHQIAFAETHSQYPVWMIICCNTSNGETIRVYHARDVMAVSEIGLRHPPQIEVTPPDWLPLFNLLSP